MKPEDFLPRKIQQPDETTIASARAHVWKGRHAGTTCPCCRQTCKVYKRVITRTMVLWLATLVRVWRAAGGRWVDVTHKALKQVRGGDYARLRHWGLIESQAGTNYSGRLQKGKWRPTELGALFADGEERVQKYAHLYLGRCIKFSGPEVSIHDAYGESFSFSAEIQNERG